MFTGFRGWGALGFGGLEFGVLLAGVRAKCLFKQGFEMVECLQG